eukprot:TRINITY_DN10236_c0_g4_i1.p1 TRINITY_DN10236_c0_g4~~TRINITY_DN10236_c0_g4_i1.p1  ORF type:complete len:875 (-),score=91.36 TRINITY_DN10236_c0_g4_i1:309-2612(-)
MSNRSGNIFQMPYTLLVEPHGVCVMQPFQTEKPAQQFYDGNFGLTLGTDTETQLSGPHITSWSELTLNAAWSSSNSTDAAVGMRVPLVRGSPFVTAEFDGVKARLSARQAMRPDGLKVDGKALLCDGEPIAATWFTLELYQSDMTWLFFVPSGSLWTCKAGPWFVNLSSVSPLRGAVRLALASGCTTGQGPFLNNHCEGLPHGQAFRAYSDALLQQAGCYPVFANITYEVVPRGGSRDVAKVAWSWTKACLPGWEETPLLQLAWPVHVPLLSDQTRANLMANASTPFLDMRGRPTLVSGDSWILTYPLFPDIGLGAFHPIREELKEEILEALVGENGSRWDYDPPHFDKLNDSLFDLPLNMRVGAGDTYWAGKFLARLARLIVIADELGEAHKPYFDAMVDRLVMRLQTWLDPNASANPFLYDETWGGIIACGCDYNDCSRGCMPHCTNPTSPPELCPAMSDHQHNFGNAWYNDHHFHYGYFVYAAAIATKFRPEWGRHWQEHILAIVRDYANPSSADQYYPVTRHKDWFIGNSWASGIQKAWSRGRNQESASEAINSYYAVYVYGVALNATAPSLARQLRNLGRLLTSMEVHAAHTYWHVMQNDSVYSNYPYSIVGILWESHAQHWTWFGDAEFVISGIQTMPVVPVLEDFLKPEWVRQHLPEFRRSCLSTPNCSNLGWSWTLCVEQAVLDVTAARHCLWDQPDDQFAIKYHASNGNSLTNSLHWIATRPGEHAGSEPFSPTSSPALARSVSYCLIVVILSLFLFA